MKNPNKPVCGSCGNCLSGLLWFHLMYKGCLKCIFSCFKPFYFRQCLFLHLRGGGRIIFCSIYIPFIFLNPSLSLIPIIHLMTTYCLPVTEDPGSSRSAVIQATTNLTTTTLHYFFGRPWRPCLHWVIIAASSAQLLCGRFLRTLPFYG